MTNVMIVKKKKRRRRSRLGEGCEGSCHRDWLRANHFSRYSCESDREHLEGVPSEESSAYLSKTALQERTAPTAARCRFKASAQSQGLIPIWGGGVGGVVTDVANVFIGPKQKAFTTSTNGMHVESHKAWMRTRAFTVRVTSESTFARPF